MCIRDRYIASRFFGKSGSMIQYVGYYIYYLCEVRYANWAYKPPTSTLSHNCKAMGLSFRECSKLSNFSTEKAPPLKTASEMCTGASKFPSHIFENNSIKVCTTGYLRLPCSLLIASSNKSLQGKDSLVFPLAI